MSCCKTLINGEVNKIMYLFIFRELAQSSYSR